MEVEMIPLEYKWNLWIRWDMSPMIILLINTFWVNKKGGDPGWASPNQVIPFKKGDVWRDTFLLAQKKANKVLLF